MYACADCGLCQTHCVTDQPLPDAIAAARAEIVRHGKAPAAVADFERRLNASAGNERRGVRQGPPVWCSLATRAGAWMPTKSPARSDCSRLPELRPRLPARAVDRFTASSLGLVDAAARLARDLVANVSASGATEMFVLRPADRWTFEYVYPKRLGVPMAGERRSHGSDDGSGRSV